MNLGDQIDHFRLESVILQDNMATLFRAVDIQSKQDVVLKIPHPGMESDAAFIDRLQREEEIGQTLNHPGILKVLPEPHRSRTYLVEEWFEGQTLRQILAPNKKLDQARAIRIALAVCDALEYMHNHGVVHRDLKPENILVDSADHIKLTNFRVAAKEGAPRLTFTNLAQIIGASAYISPEELKGSRGGARSDIYSLGVILYEMLTGKAPFPGTDPFDRLSKSPVPPSDVEPSVTPQLQEIIYRALEREHKNRYATAHEFATDLAHPERVNIAHRHEPQPRNNEKTAGSRKTILYALIALIPILVFALLIYFSRH